MWGGRGEGGGGGGRGREERVTALLTFSPLCAALEEGRTEEI